LLAQREAADEAWEDACEAAEQEIDFDALLEALDALPASEKQAALLDAAARCSTDLLANAYERLTEAKAEALLRRPAERPDDRDDDDF